MSAHSTAFHLGLHCLSKYQFRGFQYTKGMVNTFVYGSFSFSDDLKDLSKKLAEADTAKFETLAKMDEIHSNEVNKEVSKYCQR